MWLVAQTTDKEMMHNWQQFNKSSKMFLKKTRLDGPVWGANAKSAATAASCASGGPEVSNNAVWACLSNQCPQCPRGFSWLLVALLVALLVSFQYFTALRVSSPPKSPISCGMEPALMMTARHLRNIAACIGTKSRWSKGLKLEHVK